jgi:hypothetical protein
VAPVMEENEPLHDVVVEPVDSFIILIEPNANKILTAMIKSTILLIFRHLFEFWMQFKKEKRFHYPSLLKSFLFEKDDSSNPFYILGFQ